MMRWGYKTVHFELKKEGLLGSGFLDESEIEEELNEFGRNGWELVSVLEVQDGIIVIFKQPLDHQTSVSFPAPEQNSIAEALRSEDEQPENQDELVDSIEAEQQDIQEEDEKESTIGAIRIE